MFFSFIANGEHSPRMLTEFFSISISRFFTSLIWVIHDNEDVLNILQQFSNINSIKSATWGAHEIRD